MNITQIEEKLQILINSYTEESFIYELLLAYGLPKASITRLKKGNLNLSKVKGEISWKKKLFFKIIKKKDLHHSIDDIAKDSKLIKHNQRFIIVTDFKTILAVDTKTDDKLDIALKDLPKHYDFFLPWAGMEKAQHQNENPADVKAAERMAKLFDEIKKDNPNDSPEFIHNLNVFLSRLLFCFFAEDTHIFEDSQFTNGISSHTQDDGSDLDSYLDKLFDVLNTENKKRKNIPAYLDAFPYVNGGLFGTKIESPVFTRRSRKAIIESGELDWSAINPDIFGSMMQAVITPEHRGGLGMHYTSVPNIMKVIEPLFLNELYEAFDKAENNKKKLNKLLERLRNIKIFDPACGSGNFLIIAYKELRRLEMKIFKEANLIALSDISLSQFYGIEIDDFAHEIAKLSLWLAEHQMNVEFFKKFGKTKPTLPLNEAGLITHGNATQLKWEEVCPKNQYDEIYILGNPPYVGARKQSKEQKIDIQSVFKDKDGYNSLDYIACWFFKSAQYIKYCNGECAFVSTNSICQGEQVSLLWPHIFSLNLEISFCHKAFKWQNNAKYKAVVAVIIVGFRKINKNEKFIFSNKQRKTVSNISPYLTNNSNVIIYKRKKPFTEIPSLVYGNQAIDNGFLEFSDDEKEQLLLSYPDAHKFIKRLYGGNDFLKKELRWCIWVDEQSLDAAIKIPLLKERFNKVLEFRKTGGEVAKSLVDIPYRFRYVHEPKSSMIVLPKVASVRRNYLPIDILGLNTIAIQTLQVIYDSEPYIFSILSSKIHMVWVKTIAGGMKTDIVYSNSLCYNSFPFPIISKKQKDELTKNVFRILDEREKYSEKTLAQLYDPDKMPEGLKEAHRLNDLAVERCYRSKPFESDEKRLEYLFKLYEKMIEEEKNKNTLFAEVKKPKKTRKKKK